MNEIITERNKKAFTQPIQQTFIMIFILVLVGITGTLLFPSVGSIFFGAPLLNGAIIFIFCLGIFTSFNQIYQVYRASEWIEGFARNTPGVTDRIPRLLATLASIKGLASEEKSLNSISARSILDSVGSRLDESRDITRYITSLLVLTGLLGTFYGLATTVPAVVDTIRSLAPQDNQSPMDAFNGLMTGLENQLGGMGTAFSTSLLGLAGSLIVGLLELFSGHGQNRFYMELEDWLSARTEIGVGSSVGNSYVDAVSANVSNNSMDRLTKLVEKLAYEAQKSEERRFAVEEQVSELAKILDRIAQISPSSSGMAASTKAAFNFEKLDNIDDTQKQLLNLFIQSANDTSLSYTENNQKLQRLEREIVQFRDDVRTGRLEIKDWLENLLKESVDNSVKAKSKRRPG
ncbi:MAG: biopolymer transporter ExbB [Paracoccaceae bacterium]